MKNYRLLNLVTAALLSVTVGCNMPLSNTGESISDIAAQEEEVVLEPEEIGSAEEQEMGSITVHVVDSLDYVTATIDCDTIQTIYMPFYEHFPTMVSKMQADFDNECDYWDVAGGSNTTATISVSYSFYTEYTPKPRCELKMQIDILYGFSQVPVVHNSLLGDVPFELEDYIYSAPAHVFTLPGETQTIIEGMFTLSITPDDFTIPTWTGCLYQ
jgi:hypothetical protein